MSAVKKDVVYNKINLYYNDSLKSNALEQIINDKSIKWKNGGNPFSMSIAQEIKPSIYKRSHIENLTIIENPKIKLLTREIGFSCLPSINDYIKEYKESFSWVQDTFFMQYPKGSFVNHNYYNIGYEKSEFCIILSLNDDYSGGKINFVNQQVSLRLEKNQMLIFPNNEEYKYDIEQISEGTKYDCFVFLSKEKYENSYSKK